MLKPGHRLGKRYQVIKPLGKGGQSNVYLLKDLHLKGKQWVAKEMTVNYTDPRDQSLAKKHFEQEAHILATLEHPNLPQVIDYFSHKGKYYLVMEYLIGEDLGRMIDKRNRPFDEKKVARWAEQIATVLYFLHCQPKPIIFRDIKPSNIMICAGQVKLIDFGIARHFNPSKKGDTLRIGSPGYSPPEQYSGQTDPRSDVYSLGITMHHLLTNRDPANTQTPFKLPPIKAFNPDVSSRMIYIVEKATQIDPEKRYQTALEMKRDLQDFLQRKKEEKEKKEKPAKGGTPTVPHTPGSKTILSSAAVPSGGEQEKAPSTSFMNMENLKESGEAEDSAEQGTAAETVEEEKKFDSPRLLKKFVPRILRAALITLIVLGLVYGGYVFLIENIRGIGSWFSASPSPSPSISPGPVSDLEKGIRLYSNGDYAESIKALKRAREENPGDPESLIYLNNAYAAASGLDTMTIKIFIVDKSKSSAADFLSGAGLAQKNSNELGGIRGRKIIIDFDIAELKNGKVNGAPSIGGENPAATIIRARDQVDEFVGLDEINEPLIVMGNFTQNSGSSLNLKDAPTELKVRALLRCIREKGVTDLVLVRNSGFAGNESRIFLEQFSGAPKEEDLILLGTAEYSPEQLDFTRVIDLVKNKKPGGVVFLGKEDEGTQFVKSLRQKGIAEPVFVPSRLTSSTFLKSLKSEGVGVVGSRFLFEDPRSFDSANFINEYQKTFLQELTNSESAYGYDLINLIVLAGRKSLTTSGKLLSTSSLLKAVKIFNGASGEIMVRSGNDAKNGVIEGSIHPRWWAIMESSNGRWKQVGGFKLR